MSGNADDPQNSAPEPDAEPQTDETSDDSAAGVETTDEHGAPLDNPSGG